MIDRNKIVFSLLLIVSYANAEKPKYSQGDTDVGFKESDKGILLTMNEYNEEDKTTILCDFTYDGDSSKFKIIKLTQADVDFYITGTNPSYQIVTNSAYDFEKIESKLPFTLTYPDGKTEFVLTIINIDDEPPRIECTPCDMNENMIYTDSTCSCTLYDDDKEWIDKTEFDFDFNDIFKFSVQGGKARNVSVYITTLTKLDYEKKMIYIFNVELKDTGGNKGEGKVIINVKDMDDQDPIWEEGLTTKQFNEKTEQEFSISARDGDFGINNDIKFEIIDEHKKSMVTLKYDTYNQNTVMVDKIDRDLDDITDYKFKLKAIDVKNELSFITSNVTFFINDVDDHFPSITMEKTNNDELKCGTTNKVFLMDSPKSLQLEICEKHEGALPLSMTVVDKDTGDNALFDLKLEGKYATAFQVIPNAGYKTAEFQILVTNSSKLDYENPEWKNINFEILSTGQNTIKKDTYSLSITLKDWNDEYPKFEEEIYNFKIKESIAKGEIVGSVKAIDTDDGDVITYNIIGNNKLSINSDGKIYVNEDNAFDFDILESVIFQVSAIDKASHVSSPPAQVTIKIIDENNKKPVITANGVINIEENQKTGYKLDASITAIKTFKESKLTAHIDWEKSSVKWHFQDKPITKEMKCVNLKITDEHTPTLSMSLVMNQDGPDYETFDTINLFIVVTDENVDEKFLDAKEASTIIVISVEDVNDNPPIFTDDTLTTNRTVTEGNGKSTSAGVIQASDKDVDSKIVYSISSTTEFDWIGVDQNTGALSVLDTVIDADTNQLYYLYYNIKANDGLLEDDKNIKIYIIDKNNKEPTILNLKENNIIAVNEEEPKDTTFFDISYEDKDRDEAYKTVKCEITHDDCKKYFKIDYNKGVNKIAMQDKYTRESINENHPCSIRCYDNPDGNVDNQQSTSIKSFTITLMDINNNIPKIPILKYEANENILKDGIITTIEAIDPDKGENGTVSFLLLSAKKDQENVDLFSIHEIGDNKANLIATQSLEDQYGEYTIEIKVSDHGQSLQNNDTFILTLTVNKYNFRPPRFIFPDSAITRTLKVEQNVNEPLKLSTTDDTLEDIEVSYLPDKPCGDKFKYKIEIKDGNEKDVFKLKTLANCKSQLQITEKYKQDNDQTYSLKISATLEDFLPDEPSGTSEATLKIRFFEVTDPYFIDTSPMTIKMFEVQNGQTSSLNFTATYGESDVDEKTDIYYYILEKTNITEFFKVTGNKENILISQLKDLHYEETSEYSFTIAASKSDVEPNSKLPNSNLPIKVQVIDINNFRPKFPTKKFLKAVVYKIKSTTVVQLNAMDIDTIANTLSYTMGKIVTNGTHIDNILEPFKLDSKTGNINQNFDVAANMQGYFLFDVVVKDQQDDYGNGPWEDSTNVKILILDETNLVVFRFDNNLDDVVTEADQIMDKISETLKYTAQYTSIDEDKESNLILVSVWLIDGDNALLAEDILKKIADVQVFKELKTKLRSFNIQLQSFPTETYVEDLTSVLKTWLIGVSVVLSALCLILLIAFVLKTRQLSQRIKKLTDNKFGSTESNLNRLGVNAPNTNQHAVEGANPVFKNDKKSEDDIYDKKSITSGDSDLIGIEDNADFDLGNFKSERPSFSNNENLNRKTDDEFGDDFDI